VQKLSRNSQSDQGGGRTIAPPPPEYAIEFYRCVKPPKELALWRCDSGPTTILTPVERDVIANVTDDVRLPCDVQTDPAERENLVVEWRRDGVAVDPSRDRHLDVDSEDFSLHISGARVTDTASYVCHADNGLDQATSEPTNVVVRGKSLFLSLRSPFGINTMVVPAPIENFPI